MLTRSGSKRQRADQKASQQPVKQSSLAQSLSDALRVPIMSCTTCSVSSLNWNHPKLRVFVEQNECFESCKLGGRGFAHCECAQYPQSTLRTSIRTID